MKKKFIYGGVFLGAVAIAAIAWAQNTSNYKEQGGARTVIGGSLDVVSGGDIDIESGAAFRIAGTDLATELGLLSGVTASTADLNQTTNFEETFSSSTTVLTVTDGTIDLDVASHDGTNGLLLGGTLVTATAAEINQAADESANVEIVAATNVITAAESGATFFLNDTTEFVSTLPAVASGLRYTFIITGAPTGANYTIVTNASANVLNIVAVAGGGAEAADIATGRDLLTIVQDEAVAGDWIYCISDGTSWQCTGMFATAAGLTSGVT